MKLKVDIRLYSMVLVVILLILTGCSTFGSGGDEPSNTVPERANCSALKGEKSSLPDPDLPSVDFSRFSQALPQLIGCWEWKQSVVYGPGPSSVRTPATTGRTETLVFPAPPATVHVYRNDTLTRRTSRNAFFSQVVKWGMHDDTLATSSAALDGPLKIYERVE